jgi:DNA-binding MurR/RpiR family transcriptional regulator
VGHGQTNAFGATRDHDPQAFEFQIHKFILKNQKNINNGAINSIAKSCHAVMAT